MTNRKSVVEIDIQDSKWKSFVAEFAKFRVDNQKVAEEIAETAGAEAKVTAEKRKILEAQEKIAGKSKEQLADAKAEAEARRKVYDDERKKYALQSKAKDDAARERAEAMKGFRDSAKWTADIARNVASAAYGIAKWAAFSAVASGFGLGGLAANAATMRRQSQGLGINTGELRAASVNFGKYIDPESTLGNIAGAQSDLSKRWIFNALGENTTGKNAGDILPELLPKLVQAFRAGGSTLQGAQARGLDQLVGIDDLRRLSSLTEKELSDTIDAYKRDRASLLEGDDTGRAWQEFLVSLHRVSQEIEVSLLKGLTKLTPYLTQFAEGIAKAIDAFVSNGGLQTWIEKVGSALQKLGAYLGSKDFADDVETFMGAIHTMATYLAKLFPGKAPIDSPAGAAAAGKAPTQVSALAATGHVYGAIWNQMFGSEHSKAVQALEGKYLLPSGLLDSVWKKESNRGSNNGLSRTGAGGDFQFMPGVAASYGIKDRWNFDQSSDAAARLLRDLIKHYSGDSQKALAAYNWGQGNIDKDIAAHGKDWGRYAPAETQKYAGVRVVIENQTGGSAQATVAALAH